MSAADLRERRRARILMNPSERLKKLEEMHSNNRDECHNSRVQNDLKWQNHDVSEAGNFGEKDSSKEHSVTDSNDCGNSQLSTQVTDIPPLDDTPRQTTNPTEVTELDEDEGEEANEEEIQQNKSSNSTVPVCRTLLILLSGILIRFAIAAGYVQNISYPFLTLQVALLTIRYFFDSDIAGSYILKSGVWISILRLLGIDQSLIEYYGRIMGFVYLMLDDFAVYMFAFIVVHILFT